MTKQRGKKYLKSGEKAKVSGQYKNTQTKKEVTVTSGEPLPPTPKKGQKYILVIKNVRKELNKYRK